MHFLKTTIALVALLGYCIPTLTAQTYEDVTVVYDIEFDSDEMDEMSRSMLEGSTMTFMFSGKRFRMEMDMNIMNTIAITDEESKAGIVLLDMFGQKQYKTISESDIEDNQESEDDYEIEYTGETMKIAGFKTKQAFLTYANGQEIELWIAEDIVPNIQNSEFTFKGINGLPLKMDMVQDQMVMHLTAVEVNTEKPASELFDLTPPSGYTEMPDED